MPDAADTPAADSTPRLVIEAGARFEGLVMLHGSVRIDGAVEGEVVGAERLEIGEEAALRADVEAGEIHIAGRVDGAVRATRRLELGPRARVRGRIEAPALVAADGSRVDGECRMGGAVAAALRDPTHPA